MPRVKDGCLSFITVQLSFAHHWIMYVPLVKLDKGESTVSRSQKQNYTQGVDLCMINEDVI